MLSPVRPFQLPNWPAVTWRRAGAPFITWSWNGREVVVNELVEVFPTGEKEVVEIELEDGRTLRCTLDHKFYTRDADGQGCFLPLREILARGLALYTCDEPAAEANTPPTGMEKPHPRQPCVQDTQAGAQGLCR
jgi:DNA polymerase-3 subunit alpha